MGKDPQVSRESSAEWIIPAWLKWKMNQLGSPTLACSCIAPAPCISSSALAAAAVLCSCCTLCSPALDFPACKQHSISLSAELPCRQSGQPPSVLCHPGHCLIAATFAVFHHSRVWSQLKHFFRSTLIAPNPESLKSHYKQMWFLLFT